MKTAQVRYIVIGGLIAGALDILFAISFAAYNGMPPVKLLQVVASGAFGKAAFDGGAVMAALGLAAHFAMSLAWAGVFFLAAQAWPQLAGRPLVYGVLFGILVFLAMRLLVLPLSAYPFPVRFKPLSTVLDLLSHMFLFGLPIALACRRRFAAAD